MEPGLGSQANIRDRPVQRPVRVYAFDPQAANTLEHSGPAVVTVGIPWEPLQVGPAGSRVRVVDFDGGRRSDGHPAACYYEPVDLDSPVLAVQAGLAPSEADPRFHQQMVYAVAMRVIEAFDRALGRRIRPNGGVLTLLPHGFHGTNAFYDPDLRSVLFGYFRASGEDPGPNLPNQFVYTCLSHDIAAHEVTHALIDRVRPWFLQATNPDVAAFHEALADLTAIFLHFTLPGVVASTVASTRADLHDGGPLVDLAEQFGYATGRKSALRSAIDKPDPARYAATTEPHTRGAILVAAVFEAFLTSYQRRIADLIRLATGGTGQLPPGSLHPDLVARVADEATTTAQQYLTMCLRALDYLAPTDVTFSDFLRAIVTADRDLFPSDGDRLRTALIDSCRRRGIYPSGVVSLADTSLAWPHVEWGDRRPLTHPSTMVIKGVAGLDPDADQVDLLPKEAADDLDEFVAANHDILGFADPAARRVDLEGLHTNFRHDENGHPQVRIVAQFIQRLDPVTDAPSIPEVTVDNALRRSVTVIFDGTGIPVYVIAKTLPGAVDPDHTEAGAARVAQLEEWLTDRAWADPLRTFGVNPTGSSPVRINIASLHGAI